MNATGNYHFSVGNVPCISISDGSERVPVESVFKGVPAEQLRQALLERGDSPDQAAVDFNVLTLQAGQKRMLVDAGWGRGTQRRDGDLLDRLAEEGIAPADIDAVLITHGDVDHIGGILDADNRPVFANAGYILLKEAWDFWSNEALVARWPEFLTVFGRKTLPFIRDRVQVVEAGVEFLPGFRLISAPGHRPGHTVLSVTDSGEHFLHLADTVGHPLLMEHPSWNWYADARTDQAEASKAQILSQAVADRAIVFGSHLPFPAVGRIIPLAEGWCWQPQG